MIMVLVLVLVLASRHSLDANVRHHIACLSLEIPWVHFLYFVLLRFCTAAVLSIYFLYESNL